MPTRLAFGRFAIVPEQRQLLVDGQPAEVGSRAFDLLLCLVEERHRMVTKAELLERVWPDLVVEENNLSVQVSALRKLLGPGAIATLPAQGYRFTATLVEADTGAPSAESTPHEKSSIAVLPFRVLSDDKRVGFLADGLAEDVIALLARVPGFALVCRASSFEFRGGSRPLSEIGAQLGVRYVVEGSLRSMADRMRVSTQLSEAQTGRLLWSGQFESDVDSVGDLQDGITRGIMVELEPELTRAEITMIRRQRQDNTDVWGHYHQAIGTIAAKGWSEEALSEALAHLERAVAVDPNFGLAHANAAVLTALGVDFGLIAATADVDQWCIDAVNRAVTLDEGSSTVLGYAGCALCDLGHFDRGMDLLHQSLEIDPSNASAHMAVGASLVRSGQTAIGIERMQFAMRISPRDRRLGFWGWYLGKGLLALARTDEALAQARATNARDSKLYLSRILEAAALQRLGRDDEGREALAAARHRRPQLSLGEGAHTHGQDVADALAAWW
jgi:TolB-like protein/Tfp pilus assembly protein PilF